MTFEYGVNPEGFSRKPLTQILIDIEDANIAHFGPGLVQTSQTALGGLNGVAADLAAVLWELLEDVYQSIDVDQAEGARLDALGKLRRIERLSGESDLDFRRAITNAQQARIDILDIEREIAAVTGVDFVKVWVNESVVADENGLPPGSIAIAVRGGNNEEVATAARSRLSLGVQQFGNTAVDVVLDGLCRTIYLQRPSLLNVDLSLDIRVFSGEDNCPPPSVSSINLGLAQALAYPRFDNGVDLTIHELRTVAASVYGRQVEIVGGSSLPVSVSFNQILSVNSVSVTVV